MKKYVYLLFVAFFATMSFTSCNDDDEPSDPSNGKYSCSLTVNGKKFPAKKLGGEYYKEFGEEFYFVVVEDALGDEFFSFDITGSIAEGDDVSDRCNVDLDFDGLYLRGNKVQSGSVRVIKFDKSSGILSVQFNNAICVTYEGDTVTLNGIITMSLAEEVVL